jgi:hypothetical protein
LIETNMAKTNIEGGCLCGAVRYKATAAPMTVRACWCRVCQYFACGNASIGLAFPRQAVTITGETRDYPSTADSGSHMHRRFCPTCGVHLFSEAEERPQTIFVRAGTLDDPRIAVPQANIWTASAPAWAHLDPGLPHFERQPPPPRPAK